MMGLISRYLAWRMIASVGGLFLAFTLLIAIIDLIENLRFAGKYADGSFWFALQLTGLRALSLTQVLSPFLFLFGGLWCFTQLNRRSEIAVMRAAGLSIWRVILPGILVAGVAGVALITFVDPLAAKMMARSEILKNDIRGRPTSLVRAFEDGIWLRQSDETQTLIINARAVNQEKALLGNLTVYRLDPEGRFLERIDAPQALILEDAIRLQYPRLRSPDDYASRQLPVLDVPTTLTITDLNERVAKPETISIWNLSRFINLAEAAGLSTTRYYLRYHDLLSTPLKLLGMVLIAAVFSMRPIRMGGMLRLVLAAIAIGFFLYMATEISTALGESGTVPLAMAAWSPAIIATLLALTGVLAAEDG